MLRRTWSITRFCCVAGMLATIARGQAPTFSLEATEINYSEIVSGPTAILTVKPGDILRVKIKIRDWSPDGQSLRGYQVNLDEGSFASGSAGNVEPVQYRDLLAADATNEGNAHIDQDDPDFVFFGLHPLAMTETKSPGYRWLAVLIEGGIPSPQDGTKFTAGEVYLQVSDDADGKFIIAIHTDPAYSQLRDVDSNLISPLEAEPLALTIGSASDSPATRTRDPQSGQLDVFALIDVLNGVSELPASRTDLDGDGMTSAPDVLHALELTVGSTKGGG